MTKLQKLLAATSIVGAALVMATPAHAIYTVSAGTPFIKGGTVPTTLTLSGNTIVINTTDVPGVSGGEFAAAFNDGNSVTITLGAGAKFAATPTIALNGGPAPTVTCAAGSTTCTILFAGGSTGVVNSVTISNITLTPVDTTNNIVATLSGGALGTTPVTYLSKTLASFSDAISFSNKLSNITLASTTGTSTSFRDAKGTLGTLNATITATRAYDGVTAVTLGAPTPVQAVIATMNAGSLSSVVFTEGSGASAPCLPASTSVTTGLIAATNIVDSAAGSANFNGCQVGVTLNASGVVPLIASASVTLSVAGAINNAPGLTTYSSGAVSIGAITAGSSATQAIPLSYNFGADSLYGYYVSVTSGPTADATGVTFTSGPWTTSAQQVAPNSTKLFSIETIRSALITAGAPSSIFANSSARAPLTVNAHASAQVTALIQNKATGIVTEVGNNLNKAENSAGINQ